MNKRTVAKRLREIEQALAIGNQTDEQRRECERFSIAISWFVATLHPDQLDDFENLFSRLTLPGLLTGAEADRLEAYLGLLEQIQLDPAYAEPAPPTADPRPWNDPERQAEMAVQTRRVYERSAGLLKTVARRP